MSSVVRNWAAGDVTGPGPSKYATSASRRAWRSLSSTGWTAANHADRGYCAVSAPIAASALYCVGADEASKSRVAPLIPYRVTTSSALAMAVNVAMSASVPA